MRTNRVCAAALVAGAITSLAVAHTLTAFIGDDCGQNPPTSPPGLDPDPPGIGYSIWRANPQQEDQCEEPEAQQSCADTAQGWFAFLPQGGGEYQSRFDCCPFFMHRGEAIVIKDKFGGLDSWSVQCVPL